MNDWPAVDFVQFRYASKDIKGEPDSSSRSISCQFWQLSKQIFQFYVFWCLFSSIYFFFLVYNVVKCTADVLTQDRVATISVDIHNIFGRRKFLHHKCIPPMAVIVAEIIRMFLLHCFENGRCSSVILIVVWVTICPRNFPSRIYFPNISPQSRTDISCRSTSLSSSSHCS